MHPGYLVDDPEGFQNELISDLGAVEDKLDLVADHRRRAFPPRCGAAPCAARPRAKHKDSRMCLMLLGAILENPGLAERLIEVLQAAACRRPAPKPRRRS